METGLIIIALLYLALSIWAIAGLVMRSRSLARTHRRYWRSTGVLKRPCSACCRSPAVACGSSASTPGPPGDPRAGGLPGEATGLPDRARRDRGGPDWTGEQAQIWELDRRERHGVAAARPRDPWGRSRRRRARASEYRGGCL